MTVKSLAEQIEDIVNVADHPPGWWKRPFYIVPMHDEPMLHRIWREYYCRTRWEQRHLPWMIRWRAKIAKIIIVIFYE